MRGAGVVWFGESGETSSLVFDLEPKGRIEVVNPPGGGGARL